MDSIINFLGANPYQAIAVPVIGGLASGYLGNPRSTLRTWYPTLRKPPFNPPNWVFPPAWTTLYITMGYSSHLVAKIAQETLSEPTYLLARHALGIYAVQLGVNLTWMPLFFGARNPRGGLLDLGVLAGLTGAMAWAFWRVDEVAGTLCLPYLCWVGFATYLNYQIVKLNPGDGVEPKKL